MLFARLLGRAGSAINRLAAGAGFGGDGGARQACGRFLQTLVVVQQLDLGLVLGG